MTPDDWPSSHMMQCDWLKGIQMTKVVWLLNDNDYICIHVANLWCQILPIYKHILKERQRDGRMTRALHGSI